MKSVLSIARLPRRITHPAKFVELLSLLPLRYLGLFLTQ